MNSVLVALLTNIVNVLTAVSGIGRGKWERSKLSKTIAVANDFCVSGSSGLPVSGRSGVAVVAEEAVVAVAAGALAETALMLVENVNSTDTAAATDRKSCIHDPN